MRTTLRFLLLAILIWLIPFALSIPFFGADGQLAINFWLFKLIMFVVLTLTCFFLYRWFYKSALLPNRDWRILALIGVGVLIINVLLDSITVIPLGQMTAAEYVTQIGVVYLMMVASSIYVGAQQQ